MKTKLLIILVIAAFLRLWKLDSIPPHLTPDEAALGYNAYSILKTGRDEYGSLFPLIFKSFGDYKPGLYIYTTVPFVALFGLTELSVRLTSALSGIASVALIYFIVRKLSFDDRISYLSVLFLAISPWHIHFSRGAWEITLCLFLTLLGVYLFLKSIKKQKYLLASSFSFGLTLLTYQGAKLSTLIVVFLLIAFFFKKLIKIDKKILLGSVLVGVFVSMPVILSLFQGRASRLQVFSVFSYPRSESYLENFLNEAGVKKNSLVYYLFYNEPLNFARGIAGRWFNHFSTRFLFFEGDWQNPRHSPPNHGMLLLGDVVFFVIGLFLIFRFIPQKRYLFVLFWLILAPMPAVLSRDQVQAVRAFNMTVPLVIILALGANTLFKKWKIILTFAIISLSFLYYLDAYFVHLPKHASRYWEYGYKEIVQTVVPLQDKYKMIKVQQSYAQPYIYFLFYGVSLDSQKYNPQNYQKYAHLKESEFGDVGQVEQLENIYFSAIDWSVARGEKGVLFVADPIRIPDEDSQDPNLFQLIKKINYLDGSPAFKIIEVKK